MSNFKSKLLSICIVSLMCLVTLNSNVLAQKHQSSSFSNNDIDTEEPLFGQSLINQGGQVSAAQSYSNNQSAKQFRKSRKVTLDCLPGDPGCEIDDPLDSQILILIAFGFLFSVYSLNKKMQWSKS